MRFASLALAFVVVAACGSGRPSTDQIIEAARENLENMPGYYVITVAGKVEFESAKVLEVRDFVTVHVLGLPELAGWPARVELHYRANDTPGEVFEERTKTIDILVFPDVAVERMPDELRKSLREHEYRGDHRWHAWRCALEAETGCRL